MPANTYAESLLRNPRHELYNVFLFKKRSLSF